MSGLEVIGVISSIISIIDGASKLYEAIANTGHLPRAFLEVAQRLPLVRNTLQTIETRLKSNDVNDDNDTTIGPTIASCKHNAESLRNILREVAAQPDASRIQRYRLAVRRLGKGSKVEELMKSMLEDVQLLAASRAVRAVGEDKIKELMGAIQALSKVPPSAPSRGSTFTYCGTGEQINNTSSGTQNFNAGSGIQYIARSISFG